MRLPEAGSKTYQLLYADDEGVEIGLDEVQLLDDITPNRIQDTEALLAHPALFIRFQAALILAAWGQASGVEHIERMMDQGIADPENLSPHRIHGEDSRFDDMAEALDLYIAAGGNKARAMTDLRRLLGMYPDYFFASKLKHALLKRAGPDECAPLKNVIEKAAQKGRVYQASQLLPVLAKLDRAACWALLSNFTHLGAQTPDPLANVAEALRYIPTPQADALLHQYAASPNRAVALAAQESIAFRNASGQSSPNA